MLTILVVIAISYAAYGACAESLRIHDSESLQYSVLFFISRPSRRSTEELSSVIAWYSGCEQTVQVAFIARRHRIRKNK